jgi:ubiquinone/menaquinone biosynthesis C-methylase UbiE
MVETDYGIQGDFNVNLYDAMQRHLRDKGWIETRALIKSGIDKGKALEIGPGPGYLGLEWLKRTKGTTLFGVEVSPDMMRLAEKNASLYRLSNRVSYRRGDASSIPFANSEFDAVFSNGSLHEWSKPTDAFNEIHRVLKPGGLFFISDLRRDMFFAVRWFLFANTKPKAIRSGLITSIGASYTPTELRELAASSRLAGASVRANPIGIEMTGQKPF